MEKVGTVVTHYNQYETRWQSLKKIKSMKDAGLYGDRQVFSDNGDRTLNAFLYGNFRCGFLGCK